MSYTVVSPVTLSLLQGPTKALVGSVFSGAVGAAFLASSSNSSLCFTFRQAYDSDVFQGGEGASSELLETDWKRSRHLEKFSMAHIVKLRPIGQNALLKLCSFHNVSLTGARNIALSSLFTIHQHLLELLDLELEAEEKGIEPVYPQFPWKSLKMSVHVGAIHGCLDLATQLVRSLLDWAAAVTLPLELSRSVRTILRSALGAVAEFPFYKRGLSIAHSALFSESTFVLADWSVTCARECYVAFQRAPFGLTGKKQRLQRLGLRCGLQGASQGIGYLINMYANAFIARATAGWPPPPAMAHRPEAPPALPSPSPPRVDTPGRDESEGEASGRAIGDALGILNFQDQDEVGPVVQQPPAARVARVGGRAIRGGPILPPRRARQGAAPQDGPGTPQAPREPRALAENEAVEGGGTQNVAAAGAGDGRGRVMGEAHAMVDDVAPMPPETPPVRP